MSKEIIGGAKAVQEALAAPGRVSRVYVADGKRSAAAQRIFAEAKSAGVRLDVVPIAKLNALAGSRDHQGVAAAISPVAYTPLEDVFQACGPQATLAVLDRIQHESNLGLIIRSAAAAGVDALVLPSKGGALPGPAVVRASAGAIFRVPLVKVSKLDETIRLLKERDFWVFGLDAGGGDSIYSIDWPARCALVIGNESEGLRPGVRKACDTMVHIPVEDSVESLNAAVAASVAIFERRRALPGGR